MKITKEIKAKALEVRAKMKAKDIYANDKGELFTTQNGAAFSVGGDKNRYMRVEEATEVSNAEPQEQDEIKSNQLTAEEFIAIINDTENVDMLRGFLDGESTHKKRKTVIAALEDKIKSLTQNPE